MASIAEDMKSNGLRYVLVLAGFVLLAFVVFRCAWGAGNMFSTSDGNIGAVTAQHRAFPACFSGAMSSTPLLGDVSRVRVLPIMLGAWLMSPEMFSDTWYAIYLVVSSVALVAYLRLWRLHWLSSICGALAAFWVGSITLSAAGHLGKLGVMAYATLALYPLELALRAQRSISRVLLGSAVGILVGAMLLVQQDVGLFAGLFLGGYTCFRLIQVAGKRWQAWLQLVLPIALVGGGLALRTSLTSYKTQVVDAGLSQEAEARWDFVTQWSMVPEELADLVAPGYTGWSSGNVAGPYWGKIGRSPGWEDTGQGFQNFRLDGLYIGVIPIFFALLAVYLAIARRKEEREFSGVVLCWVVFACVALLLACGKYSPLYKAFFHLPLVGSIRAPIKFLHNFQVFIGILCAYAVDRAVLLTGNRFALWRYSGWAAAGFVILFVGLYFSVDVNSFSGWGQFASVISGNIKHAWAHAAIMSVVLAGGFLCLVWKPNQVVPVTFSVLLVLCLAVDSILWTSHYFKAVAVAQYEKGNPVINYLRDNQGDERIYFTSTSGGYNAWIGVDGPYHGLNIFNYWQMPRMSGEYKRYLGAAGRNMLRLWQLTSCRYVAASAEVLHQEGIAQLFQPRMFFRFAVDGGHLTAVETDVPTAKDVQVLLELERHIPRLALFHAWEPLPLSEHCDRLFSAAYDPMQRVLVDSDQGRLIPASTGGAGFEPVESTLTSSRVSVTTRSEMDGVLLFTQRFQPSWRVLVDGKPAELLRCNFLCMGVFVPAGEHAVTFDVRGR